MAKAGRDRDTPCPFTSARFRGIHRDAQQASGGCVALGAFGAPSHLIDHAELLDPDAVTFFGVPPLRIDLLSSVSGIESDRVFDSAIEETMAGQRVRVIGRQALEANKLASGRDKDLRDLRALARMDRPRR